MEPSSKNLVRSWFKKVALPLLRSLGRPDGETSGVPTAQIGGGGSWQQGAGGGPGNKVGTRGKMQEAVTCGIWQVTSSAVGLGSEGSRGLPGGPNGYACQAGTRASAPQERQGLMVRPCYCHCPAAPGGQLCSLRRARAPASAAALAWRRGRPGPAAAGVCPAAPRGPCPAPR